MRLNWCTILYKLSQHFISFTIISINLSGILKDLQAQKCKKNLYSKFILLFTLVSSYDKNRLTSLEILKFSVIKNKITPDLPKLFIKTGRFPSSKFDQNLLCRMQMLKITPILFEWLFQLSNYFIQVFLINSELNSKLDRIPQFCGQNEILIITFDSTYMSSGVAIGICSEKNYQTNLLGNWAQMSTEVGGFDNQIHQLVR